MANTNLEDVDKMDIYAYKRKIETQINRLEKKGKGIDVDALVPDSELIQMSNPYREMARRRRGLEAEGITTNPLLWTGATVIRFVYRIFKSN